jgi:sterol desaturase/sphingolipid hydroxylase (fatty acid hydroxylase superfamily)
VQAELFELIATPAGFFLDPGKRVYWLCLLSTLVIASIVITVQSGKFDLKNQMSSFFNPKYWFAKSSLYDVYLMLFNNALRILLLIPLFGSHIALTIFIGSFLQDTVGDAPVIALNWFVIAFIFSVTFFVIEDFSRFCLHYCMHKYKFLWRFHKTHHSATILTPITIFRVHPVEHILYFLRGMLVFGVISGVFIWLFSGKLTALQVLGVDMFGFLFNFFAANLRHSHIWLSFGKLERFLVSPAQHQLHHSSKHNFANLGSTLSIWDGIMGTRLFAKKRQKLQFGLNIKTAE